MFEKLNSLQLKPEWFPKWIIMGITVLICYYKYSTKKFGTFKKLGVKGPKPYPVFGNLIQIYSKGVPAFSMELKQKYGSVVGTFFLQLPILHIYDIDMLKQIMIKDFHIFTDHFLPPTMDPPIDKMAFFLKGPHWKHVRSILSPTFSSGKLRKMSSQLNQCGETFCENLRKKSESGEAFDFYPLCGAFVIQATARTAFGLEINSNEDPENLFVKNAASFFQLKPTLPSVLCMFFPFLYKPLKFLGAKFMDRNVISFFVDVIHKAIDERKKTSGHVDFLQIMLNAHLEDHKMEETEYEDSTPAKITTGLTNEDVLGQGFVFFLGGFETTVTTLAFFGYCMATNLEIQEKLRQEIVEHFGENEDPTFDSIKDLVYLDMCISETLRMYPPGPVTDRVAGEDVTINGLFIPKGMVIGIPIYALHHDSEYWNEPEEFNPERFSPSNRPNIDPFHYMPFGTGPRVCVGMRFALMEIKMLVVKMLKRFEFQICKETEVPLVLDPFSMKSKNGIKLKVIDKSLSKKEN